LIKSAGFFITNYAARNMFIFLYLPERITVQLSGSSYDLQRVKNKKAHLINQMSFQL